MMYVSVMYVYGYHGILYYVSWVSVSVSVSCHVSCMTLCIMYHVAVSWYHGYHGYHVMYHVSCISNMYVMYDYHVS